MGQESTFDVVKVGARKASGWGTARAKDANGEAVSLVGNGVGRLNPGDRIEALGDMKHHSIYGEQFAVTEYKKIDTPQHWGLIEWLKSFKGIGPAKATALEEIWRTGDRNRFDQQFFGYCSARGGQAFFEWARPELASLIDTSKTYGVRGLIAFMRFINEQAGAWNDRRPIKDCVKELVVQWKKDPYEILLKAYFFKEADAYLIGQDVVRYDDPNRLRHILAFMTQHRDDTLHDVNELSYEANNDYGIPLWDMVAEHKIPDTIRIIEIENTTYLQDRVLASCETAIAANLRDLFTQKNFEPVPVAREFVKGALPFALNEDQWQAVESALAHPISIITGGPGTGKTTILKAVIQSLSQDPVIGPTLGNRVLMCAPTNKAARRMSQQSGIAASSIHRMLGATAYDNPQARAEGRKKNGLSFNFRVDENAPLENKIIIVDESSMVDTRLMAALLRGVDPETSRVIFVGDDKQLPPISEGMPFKDFMETTECLPAIDTSNLTHVMRADPGRLLLNANSIRRGALDQIRFGTAPDWEFVECDTDDWIMKHVVRLGKHLYNSNQHNPFSFQIITPRRFGHALSAYNINKAFREEVFQQSGANFVVSDKGLCGGDNDSDLINGDFFEVTEIVDNDWMRVSLEIPRVEEERVRKIARYHDSWMQGWAITIHKYQGCEAPYIVIPISSTFGSFPSRAMLYTALTRAQKKVYIVGSKRAFMDALENVDPVRTTGFRLGVVEHD